MTLKKIPGNKWWTKTKDEVLSSFESQEEGLSTSVAHERLALFGKNQLPQAEPESIFHILIDQFKNVIVWVLLIASFLAFYLGGIIDGSAILAITLLNALLGFIQELRSTRSIEALFQYEKEKAKVIRDNKIEEILSEDLTLGDIVSIEAGDLIPADGRLISSHSLSVSEASLTGESSNVYKTTEPIDKEDVNLGDRTNLVFRGTHVSSGNGQMIVTHIGEQTELGKIAKSLQSQDKQLTPLQQRLDKLGKKLIYLCLGIIGIIFIAGFIQGFEIYTLLMTSISLAIAAIPEGLPAVVTIALSIGVQKMVKQKALIRKLTAVETLGCTRVICTDKTGTLTENKMQVEEIHAEDEKKALQILLLCNHATEEVGDPTEIALYKKAVESGLKREDYPKIEEEIPFDSDRKMMSVRIGDTIYTKGALEKVLEKTTDVSHQDLKNKEEELTKKGFRVLALAMKKASALNEENLSFIGLVALRDPPREEVKEFIEECRKASIKTMMLTGDHKNTGMAIAKEIGILTDGESLEGSELEKLTDEELDSKIDKIQVLARITAHHKMRVVEALQRKKEVVAMTGDGVNDAPAIKKADIGVAMGITGTDVTKSASDMIILDDNFSTIVKAVEEGRTIFDNIVKFTSYLFSCNLAEVLIIFFSIFFLGWIYPDPNLIVLAPIHLLWINFVTDGLPAIALANDPLSKRSMEKPPREKEAPLFTRNWLMRLSVISVVIASITLIIFFLNLPDEQTAKTTAFTALVLLELSKAFILRIPYQIPFFSNIYLIIAVFLSLIMQLVVVYLPDLHPWFQTVSLGIEQWIEIGVGLVILFLITWPLMKFKQGAVY